MMSETAAALQTTVQANLFGVMLVHNVNHASPDNVGSYLRA
jgi:hypothetical protein